MVAKAKAGELNLAPRAYHSGDYEEIGWMLAREHWGHGYASEAALALRDWALAERGLTRLISLIRPGNEASVRVAARIGEKRNFGQDDEIALAFRQI